MVITMVEVVGMVTTMEGVAMVVVEEEDTAAGGEVVAAGGAVAGGGLEVEEDMEDVEDVKVQFAIDYIISDTDA